MRLDMDYARAVMLAIEGDDSFNGTAVHWVENIAGADENKTAYTLHQLINGGFVDGKMGNGRGLIKGLTYKGHQFLETTRDNSIWKQATQTVASKAGAFTLELAFEVAKSLLRQKLGLPV